MVAHEWVISDPKRDLITAISWCRGPEYMVWEIEIPSLDIRSSGGPVCCFFQLLPCNLVIRTFGTELTCISGSCLRQETILM